MNRPMRTARPALPAADAVKRVRIFVHANVELAHFLARAAFRAFFTVDFEAVERDFVEDAVNSPERANIPAERTVYYNRRKQRD